MNRSVQVEGAFGLLKEDYAFRRFLTGGKHKTQTQFLLLSFEFKIQKLCNRMNSGRFYMSLLALRTFLCKKKSTQIRKQITNMVFRSENGGIHLPVLAARSMLYDGMRTAGVNSGIRHRAY